MNLFSLALAPGFGADYIAAEEPPPHPGASTFYRPDGTSLFLRPDGTSSYFRP